MSAFSDTAVDYSLYEFDKKIWFGREPRFGNPWMSWMRGGDALGHHHHGDSVQRFARYRRPSKPVYHPKQISSPNLHKLSSKTTTANEVSFLGSFRSPTRPGGLRPLASRLQPPPFGFRLLASSLLLLASGLHPPASGPRLLAFTSRVYMHET